MKCDRARRMLAEIEAGGQASEKKTGAETLEAHLRECPSCRSFRNGLSGLHDALQGMPRLQPPPALVARTKSVCLEELRRRSVRRPLPAALWAVLVVMTVLTGGVIASLLEGFSLEQPLSLRTTSLIAILLQNILMLLLSPILLHRLRSRNNGARP